MNIPSVTFIYAYPLDSGRRDLFEKKKFGPYPSFEEVRETKEHWERLWQKTDRDSVVIQKLIDVTHRVPRRALECFVYGRGLDAMSAPFLMSTVDGNGVGRSDKNFIETTIHELLHIFATTDTTDYWSMIREKYSQESRSTQNHIVIYAMLAKICQDLFHQMPQDFSRTDLPEGYKRAIDIVKDTGYEQIIAEYDASVQ
jgi:hypothetical protein